MKKKVLLIGVLMCMAAVAVYAGSKGCCGKSCSLSDKKIEKKLSRMTKKLDLTDSQRAEMKDLIKSHHKKIQSVEGEFHTSMKGVLNEDQAAKFDKKIGKSSKECEFDHNE